MQVKKHRIVAVLSADEHRLLHSTERYGLKYLHGIRALEMYSGRNAALPVRAPSEQTKRGTEREDQKCNGASARKSQAGFGHAISILQNDFRYRSYGQPEVGLFGVKLPYYAPLGSSTGPAPPATNPAPKS